MPSPNLLILLCVGLLAGCTGAPVYPTRPPATAGAPIVEPEPSKLTVHITATLDGLKLLMETAVPTGGESTTGDDGEGQVYFWERGPFDIKVADGKVNVEAQLKAGLELPVVGRQSVNLTLQLNAEPVLTSDYTARLQGAELTIESADMTVRAANVFLGVLELVKGELQVKIDEFAYNLTPHITEAYQKLAKPIDLPLGGASGCAVLKLAGVEAGPTVLAGGFEKDIAVTISPSVTLPCTPPALPEAPPPLANVATMPTGPFTVVVPIAARYDELAKTMSMAFTDNQLFFSEEYPELYLTSPAIYPADDKLVVKLGIGGSAAGMNLDGDIFLYGSPVVEDNELKIPDLEPTVDTNNFLVNIVTQAAGDDIRKQARKALRLDIGERLAAVKNKLTDDFSFGEGMGCLRTDVSKIAVTDIFTHGNYLRLYVAVTAQAAVYVPCPGYVAPTEGDAVEGGQTLPADNPADEPNANEDHGSWSWPIPSDEHDEQ